MANTENQPVKGKRDLFLARFKDKYPDKNFEDDEELFGQISDDYDDYDRQIGEYQGREESLNKMFAADPRSASFVASWADGEDPAVGLVRLFGDEIRDALDDPEKLDAIAEANKEYVERVAKNKQLEEEYQDNLQESLKMLEAYQQEHGLTDEQIDNAMEYLGQVVADGIVGKFSVPSLEFALKAINHDGDVEAASYEGEVRGKNAKIEERLRKGSRGDGTAKLDGRNSSVSAPYDTNLGALNNFGDEAQDIWSRGDEKRTKYNQ